MLQATLRSVGLRSELFSNSSLRQFIHNIHCTSGAIILQHIPTTAETVRPSKGHGFSGEQSMAVNDQTNARSNLPLNTNTSLESKSAKKQQRKTRSTEPSAKTMPTKERTRARKFVEPPPENVESFLHRLESEKDTLTLEDMERYRPSKIPDTRSSRYESEYNDALNALTRSFNLVTFRKIFELYKIPQLATPLQKKNNYAQAILDFWGWKSLSEVKEDILDTTKSSELRFPLSSEEAFLLMGKDGFDFLNLAKRYGVHLSFTDHPIFLKAKGLQGSLKRLKGYLNSFKNDIQKETAHLPLDQSTSLETIKSISRLSGAFLSPEDDKFRISFHKSQPRASEIAKRLAAQVSSKGTSSFNRPIWFHLGYPEERSPDSSLYSLYPFTPQERLPWIFSSSGSFRLRRIGHWMQSGIPTNMLSKGQMPSGRFSSSDRFTTDLKNRLLNEATNESTRVVTARVGHFLFITPFQEQTLSPPMAGKLNEEDALQWAQNFPGRVAFNHNVPATISTSPAYKEQHIRQLVYVEQMTSIDKHLGRTIRLEIPQRTEDVHGNLDHHSDELVPRCYISTESTVDILCPDLPADIQLSAADKREIIPSDLPDKLSALVAGYGSRLPHNPIVPLACVYYGGTFLLTTDERIYREFKRITLDDTNVAMVTETSTDVDINEQRVLCKVICKDHESPDGWKSFLDISAKIAAAM